MAVADFALDNVEELENVAVDKSNAEVRLYWQNFLLGDPTNSFVPAELNRKYSTPHTLDVVDCISNELLE